jgi:DNA-binding response OmpR family regulator
MTATTAAADAEDDAGSSTFLITDWNMPGMPGLDLLKQVRADARSPACRC